MTMELSKYADYKVEQLVELGHSRPKIEKHAQTFKSKLLSTSGYNALITSMDSCTGGFIERGNRSNYHLSEALSEAAIINGDFEEIVKIAGHESVHLDSAQEFDFKGAGFDKSDYGVLMEAFDLQPKIGEESPLEALSRYLIEGLTESKNQERHGKNHNCAYTDDEVPATENLVRSLQRECGIDLKAQFRANQPLKMAQSLKFFANYLRIKQDITNFSLPASAVYKTAS